jgi:hypothetical protein
MKSDSNAFRKSRWRIRAVLSLTAVGILLTIILLAFAQRRTDTNQTRPRRAGDTPSQTSAGPVINLAAGGDLQRALDNAKCGDTIVLQPGAVYKPRGESFVLPPKPACSGTDADYITIRTANLQGLSAPGERIEPAKHAAAMPKLINSNGNFVMIAKQGAHHYKFIGIEFTTSGPNYVPDLINFGAYFTRPERLATHHFVFDRVFLHPQELTPGNLFPTTVERTVGRGMALGVSEVWVTNSYIAGFAGKYPKTVNASGQSIDSYGIYSDAGPGPIRIVNNYIEAQFNNIFIGGGGLNSPNTATVSNATTNSATLSTVSNLTVGDLVAFSYRACVPSSANAYAKPWQTGRVNAISGNNIRFTLMRGQYSCNTVPPENGGTARWRGDLIHDIEIRHNTLNKPDVWNAFSNPKAWIEIKLAKGLVIDGNDMYSGVGTTIALTVRNQDGGSPWSTIEDVKITNNRVRGYKWGFSLLLTDNEQPSTIGKNILIRNNLFYEPRSMDNSAVNFLQLVSGDNITVQHNTLLQPGNPVVSEHVTNSFVFRDNIVANYQYGMQCSAPSNTLASCWPGMIMTGNVIIDTRWDKGDGALQNRYPAGNYYVNSPKDVGFVDITSGNFELAPTSKFKGKASDRTDPGCDMNALRNALAGR